MSQPAPTGDGPEVLPHVIAFLEARGRRGLDTYGTPLKAHNGRDALTDLREELADALCYLTQAQMEREWEDTYLRDALRRTRAEVRYWRKRCEDAERAR